MFIWLVYDKPWILPAGGAVVGYLTNWLAIKLIFEPVDPVKFGPFVLQGLFLKRQNEVRFTIVLPPSLYELLLFYSMFCESLIPMTPFTFPATPCFLWMTRSFPHQR